MSGAARGAIGAGGRSAGVVIDAVSALVATIRNVPASAGAQTVEQALTRAGSPVPEGSVLQEALSSLRISDPARCLTLFRWARNAKGVRLQRGHFHEAMGAANALPAGEPNLLPALDAWHAMRSSGVRPSTFTLNLLLSAAVSKQKGADTQAALRGAVEVVDELQEAGVGVDAVSSTRLLALSGRANQPDLVKQLLSEMHSAGVRMDERVYAAAFNSLGMCDEWREALDLHETVLARGEGDLIGTAATTALLRALAKAGRWKEVLTVMDMAQSRGVGISTDSCNALLTACARDGTHSERWKEHFYLWTCLVNIPEHDIVLMC